MTNYFFVFLGGGIGASARYWLSGLVYRFFSPSFPYGSLIVNVSGCFFIGFLMAAFEDRFLINPGLRTFLAIGILGGFTTFSSFSYETISLLRDSEFLFASLNIVLTVCLCLAGTFIGMILGKLV